MHELSIALSIVDVAGEEAARHGGAVSAIHVRLGRLSGVVKDALLSAFALAAEGTALEASRLVIEEMPIVIHCPICDEDLEANGDPWFECPACGTPATTVVRGKELEVASLELES